MYEDDLSLNNLPCMIYHKTKPNPTFKNKVSTNSSLTNYTYIYIYIYIVSSCIQKSFVHKVCVLMALLYASETWTLYKHLLKLLEGFHQRCLRQILHIKW